MNHPGATGVVATEVPPDPAFELRNVSQERGGVTALRNVSLAFPAGKVSALIGPSGSGKSALLRLLNRLDDPTAGRLYFQGTPLEQIDVRELRRRVGFVFQVPVPFDGSVRDNLTAAARLAAVDPGATEDRMRQAAELADLDPLLLDRPASRLSGGQVQRLTIARALMSSPEVLVMDEPTASLDPETAARVGQTVVRLSREGGITIIMATHRLKEAKAWCPFVAMLDQGAVVESGPSDQLFSSDHPRVRAFLSKVA